MNIQHESAENTGRFYLEENNTTLAELDYQLKNKTLLILHTEVDKNLAGKGVGRELVAAAVDYVRNNSLTINATCPYAKKVLDRTPEVADVYNAEKR